MNTEEEKQKLLQELEEAFSKYLDSELFTFVLSDLLNYVGVQASSNASIIQKLADKRTPVYQKFSQRHAQLNSLLTFSHSYHNSMQNRVKEIYTSVDFDESGSSISKIMKDLFRMDDKDREAVIMSMEMIKKGKIPTFINFGTIEKQELAKRSNLPLEYVTKVISFIPDVIVNE